jgi:hypothetical protein
MSYGEGLRIAGGACGYVGGLGAGIMGTAALVPFLPCAAAAAVVGGVLGGTGAMLGMMIGYEDPKNGALMLIAAVPVVREFAAGKAAVAGTAALLA